MPIPIPVTKTKIQTAPWGIPITNEVNRLTTATAATAWTGVTFQNGWVNFGDGIYQVAQYRKVGDMVQTRGLIKSGVIPSVVCTLPAGYRPPAKLQFAAESGNAHAWFEIGNDGILFVAIGNPGAMNITCTFSITP